MTSCRILYATAAPPLHALVIPAFAVALFAMLAGVAFPATVHYICGTLTPDGIAQRLPDGDNSKETYKKESVLIDNNKSRLESLNQLISTSMAPPKDIDKLLLLHSHLTTQSNRTRSVRVAGYLLDDASPIWPLLYFFLGLLLLLSASGTENAPSKIRWSIILLIPLLAFHRWPTLLRNLVLQGGDSPRSSYSYASADVNIWGFLCQEAMGCLACVLLALIWGCWLSDYKSMISAEQPNIEQDNPLNDVYNVTDILMIQQQFLRWQIASALLFGAFAYYSYFFWRQIAIHKEAIYFAHAIIVHMLWLATWILVSLPMIHLMRKWSRTKFSALCWLSLKNLPSGETAAIEALERFHPLSSGNIVGSTIITITAIALPFIQSIIF